MIKVDIKDLKIWLNSFEEAAGIVRGDDMDLPWTDLDYKIADSIESLSKIIEKEKK